MPLFEFICQECGMHFEELLRTTSAVDAVRCPGCEGAQVKKQISRFAARVAGSKLNPSFSSPATACNTGST